MDDFQKYDVELQNIIKSLKPINNEITITQKTTLLEWIQSKYDISNEQLFKIYQLYVNAIIHNRLLNKKNLYSWIIYNDDTHPIYKFIKTLFQNNYRHISESFRNFLQKIYRYEIINKHKKKIDEIFNTHIIDLDLFLFNKLMKFKYLRLVRIIGCGCQGIIFDNNWYITKILYMNRKEIEQYIKGFNKNLQYFPKIYHYLNCIICEEKLKTYTQKCKNYGKLLNPYDQLSYYTIIKEDRNYYKICNLPKDEKEILKWGTEIFNTELKDFYDMIEGNVGERENGEIVLFDP